MLSPLPFNCGSLRAGAKSEHLYRGSCYQSINPGRCYDALCMFSVCTQEICIEEEREKDVCRAKLFFLTYSPQVVSTSCHLGNLASVESLSIPAGSWLVL